jgi:hypothetical protein
LLIALVVVQAALTVLRGARGEDARPDEPVVPHVPSG